MQTFWPNFKKAWVKAKNSGCTCQQEHLVWDQSTLSIVIMEEINHRTPLTRNDHKNLYNGNMTRLFDNGCNQSVSRAACRTRRRCAGAEETTRRSEPRRSSRCRRQRRCRGPCPGPSPRCPRRPTSCASCAGRSRRGAGSPRRRTVAGPRRPPLLASCFEHFRNKTRGWKNDSKKKEAEIRVSWKHIRVQYTL